MKKLNFIVLGTLLAISLATRALAETTIPWTKEGCESVKGKWITAHSPTDDGCDAAHCNGLNFCRSSQDMNFWSALIWCKSIGRELVSFSNLCPGTLPEVKETAGTCANATNVGTGQVITNLPIQGSRMITVRLDNGFVTNSARGDVYGRGYWGTKALCE